VRSRGQARRHKDGDVVGLREPGPRITSAVDNTDDFDSILNLPKIDDVVAHAEATQAISNEVGARFAYFRICAQQRTASCDISNLLVRGREIVLRYV
jgi:hypothetical protein